MATDYKRMQQRGRTEADLLTEDEVPLAGELIVAADTGKTWPGDGVSTLTALPYYATVDAATGQLPDDVRATLADNFADPSTPEGAALAQLIGSGGTAPLVYDPSTGLYTVPASSALSYDSASGLYTTN